MAEYSEDGIIGFNLMLEHLHPNQEGYFIIGKTFAASLLEYLQIPEQNLPQTLDDYKEDMATINERTPLGAKDK